jgi:Tol biopolymer transport system component
MKYLLISLLTVLLFSCSNNKSESKNESIVYLKVVDGNIDLYKSDVLGQWEERLTTNAGWDWRAQWILGLRELSYYTRDEQDSFAFVKGEVGSLGVDTINVQGMMNPQLSPDGSMIYFLEKDGIAQNIKRVPIDGGVDEYVTYYASYHDYFSLSPDHSQIAFVSNRDGSNQLYVQDLSTKEVRQLTTGPMIAKYNTWSPDGRQIAVCLAEPADDPKWDIYLYDLEGNVLTQFTDTPYSEQEISWSLTGKKIAFHGTSENDGDQIYTIDIADGKFTKITSGNFYHGEPAWVRE